MMTYSVMQVENGRTQIIGTIWAGEEADAQAMATDVHAGIDPHLIVVRPAEQTEVPVLHALSRGTMV